MIGAEGDCALQCADSVPAASKAQEFKLGYSNKPIPSWQRPVTSFFEQVSNPMSLRMGKDKENKRPKERIHDLKDNFLNQEAIVGHLKIQKEAKREGTTISSLLPTPTHQSHQVMGKGRGMDSKEQVQDVNVLCNTTKMCFHCQKEFRSKDKVETHLKKRHLTTCKICQVMKKVQEIYGSKQENKPGSFLAGNVKRVSMKSEDVVNNSSKVSSLNNYSKCQSHCEYVGETKDCALKRQKLNTMKDAISDNISVTQGSTSGESTPVLLGAFREFAIAERAKLRVMQPELPFKKVRAKLQSSWWELGAGGRRDWEKWARRNYQTALLRQSQESQEYSSGDEDFV